MKRIVSVLFALSVFALVGRADDKPVTFQQLPDAAKNFITSTFPSVKVTYATKDDDFIYPDYEVLLANGVKIEFDNSGRLESIRVKEGSVPAGVVPVQILDYVKAHYPDAVVREYEVGLREYEVKLSNRLELKFNKNFQLIEIDD